MQLVCNAWSQNTVVSICSSSTPCIMQPNIQTTKRWPVFMNPVLFIDVSLGNSVFSWSILSCDINSNFVCWSCESCHRIGRASICDAVKSKCIASLAIMSFLIAALFAASAHDLRKSQMSHCVNGELLFLIFTQWQSLLHMSWHVVIDTGFNFAFSWLAAYSRSYTCL